MTDSTFEHFSNVIYELTEYEGVPTTLIEKIYNYALAQDNYISELMESLTYYETG